MRDKRMWMSAALALVLAGCGGDDEAKLEWRGSEPHVALDGAGGGQQVDLAVEGAEAADTAQVACTLEYHGGVLSEVELTVHRVDGTIEKEYQVELQGVDFATLAPGTRLAVVTPVNEDEMAPAGQVHVEVQWEWETGGEFVKYEQQAASGTVVFGELSGTPDATGVIPSGTGRLGAALELQLAGGDSLRGSFSANCAATDVEP